MAFQLAELFVTLTSRGDSQVSSILERIKGRATDTEKATKFLKGLSIATPVGIEPTMALVEKLGSVADATGEKIRNALEAAAPPPTIGVKVPDAPKAATALASTKGVSEAEKSAKFLKDLKITLPAGATASFAVIDQLASKADEAGERIRKALQAMEDKGKAADSLSSVLSHLSSQFEKLTGISTSFAMSLGTVGGAIAGVGIAGKRFMELADQTRFLSAEMDAMGKNSGAVLPVMRQLADEATRMGMSVDQARETMQIAAQTTDGSAAAMRQYRNVAIGLGRAMGGDFTRGEKLAMPYLQGNIDLIQTWLRSVPRLAVEMRTAKTMGEDLHVTIERIAKRGFDIQMTAGVESYSNAITQARNAVEKLWLVFVDVFGGPAARAVTYVANAVVGLAETIRSLITASDGTIEPWAKILGYTGLVLAVLVPMQKVLKAASLFQTAWTLSIKAAGLLMVPLNAAMAVLDAIFISMAAINPFVLIALAITAVIALVGALWYAFSDGDEVSSTLKATFEGIKTAWQETVKAMQYAWIGFVAWIKMFPAQMEILQTQIAIITEKTSNSIAESLNRAGLNPTAKAGSAESPFTGGSDQFRAFADDLLKSQGQAPLPKEPTPSTHQDRLHSLQEDLAKLQTKAIKDEQALLEGMLQKLNQATAPEEAGGIGPPGRLQARATFEGLESLWERLATAAFERSLPQQQLDESKKTNEILSEMSEDLKQSLGSVDKPPWQGELPGVAP